MAPYVMVLRSATSFRGALEGVGPENRDFFGPRNDTSVVAMSRVRYFNDHGFGFEKIRRRS
jgi:hypothetical protein